jgi:hypothetical protein
MINWLFNKTGWLPFSLFAAADVERVGLLARIADAVRVLRFDPELVPGTRNQVVNGDLK